jgi:transposase
MNPNSTNSTSQLFVGIDIAAATATAAWLTSNSETGTAKGTPGAPGAPGATKPFTFDQTPTGFALLIKKLKATGIAPQDTLVVMEATSTYWIMLASTLHETDYLVSVVNPAQAHHFAKALLKRAKTDQLDALTLASLAQTVQPQPWTPPPAIYHELQQRLALRDSLLSMLGQVRNQLHALQHNLVVIPSVRSHMQQLIHNFEEQIRAVDVELKAVVQNDKEWGQAIVRLQSIKGIGPLTASWLVVSTLNFSCCANVSSLCSYMGLAPMPRQSGSSVRGRPSIGHSGKGRARTALYLATLSAVRYNPPIRAFYERLRAAGKSDKVARCAAARKLLVIAWAIAKKGTKFDPAYKSSPDRLANPGVSKPVGA